MIPALIAGLLAKGLGTIASAVINKGVETVEEKLGINIESSLKTDEGLQSLNQAQIDHEEFLLNAAIENRKIDLQEFQVQVADTADARKANADIQDSFHASWNAKNASYLIDYVIVGGTIALAYLIFFVGIPPANKDIAFAAFGSMMTLCGTVVNFHRGSSRQSQTKNYTVDALAKKLGEAK